ncbi:hypothetical protein P4E94_19385 [Pontiellaceae bacterium B12219]|nr:hypothetical protein [Pontiellaceae bacterium B12219]
MKRYRILSFDFDARAHHLKPIPEHWEDRVKEVHLRNQEAITQGLALQYGQDQLEAKIKNFIDLEAKPISVTAFHNKFLAQVRSAYVIGSYYPALTGACALGERILNHMILLLRDYHKSSTLYKKVYRKDSFDDWTTAIDTLEEWKELLPKAVTKFRELQGKRNSAIHFNPEIDHNDKELALEAIHIIQNIVEIQFSSFGTQPWYFSYRSEIYIRKEWETKPFIKHIFLPNALLVGPKHNIESVQPKFVINDRFEYEDKEITDDQFIELRKKMLTSS